MLPSTLRCILYAVSAVSLQIICQLALEPILVTIHSWSVLS